MADRSPRSRADLIPFKQLHRQVELGWKDLDAGRVLDFDSEDIKRRGRKRLALMSAAGLTAARSKQQEGS
jgi:hypothetical protein